MPLGDDAAALLGAEELGRADRSVCVAFVTDGATETALQAGLADVLPGGIETRRGGIRAAIVALQKMPTPRLLIVDVSGEDAPLATLEELTHVVEPHVCVLVVGDATSLDFYREVTRYRSGGIPCKAALA